MPRGIASKTETGVGYDSDVFLLLAAEDNVLIARRPIEVGEKYHIDSISYTADVRIGAGFKVARYSMKTGATVLKYGAPIGSATRPLSAGELIHVHNMKSDYLPTYTHEEQTFTNRGEKP